MIGDQGALALAEALKDDLWLKGKNNSTYSDASMIAFDSSLQPLTCSSAAFQTLDQNVY
jgi:hypothetical protein